MFEFLKSRKPVPDIPIFKVTYIDHHRLTVDQYKAFEKSLPGLGEPRTDLQAGYLLGIQHALKVLRDGWVIGV